MTKTPQHKRLLVTGSNGRLGQLLRAAWPGLDAPIEVDFATRAPGADLRLDPAEPWPALPRYDAVLALWGATSGSDDQLAQNSALAEASRDLARACGASRVFHLSSAAVYGPGAEMDETAPTATTSPYGLSKLAMETRVADFPEDGIRHICLRLANVVGADSLRAALLSDAPARMDRFDDGRGPIRSYIAPGSLARIITALTLLAPGKLPKVLNIAAPDPVGMADLVEAAGRQITWVPAPATATQTVTLNTHALSTLLPDLRLARSASEMIADWQRCLGAQ